MKLRYIKHDLERANKCTRFEFDIPYEEEHMEWTLSIYRAHGEEKQWFVELLHDEYGTAIPFVMMSEKENNDLQRVAKRAMFVYAEWIAERQVFMANLRSEMFELFGGID